jgi:hypothetical protein
MSAQEINSDTQMHTNADANAHKRTFMELSLQAARSTSFVGCHRIRLHNRCVAVNGRGRSKTAPHVNHAYTVLANIYTYIHTYVCKRTYTTHTHIHINTWEKDLTTCV